MARTRKTYHVVERGRRLPGGSITWRVEVEALDYFYASHVCMRIQQEGNQVRRREITTARSIPVTPGEVAWCAERLRKRKALVAENPQRFHLLKD